MRTSRRILPLAALAASLGCVADDPAATWLRSGFSQPGPAGSLTYHALVTDMVGDDAWLFDTISDSLYTIVLDGLSPATGSTVQIREMSGSRTGRVVFRVRQVVPESANFVATLTFPQESARADIAFNFGGRDRYLSATVDNFLQINRTMYLNTSGPVSEAPPDPCVADTEAPLLAFDVREEPLWPANGAMHRVATGILATDNLDTNPQVEITVTSSDAVTGAGDLTAPDWLVEVNPAGGFDVSVRAERRGSVRAGRRYTITAVATDACGNVTSAERVVTVPHDMGRGR